jgi:hypothetical protein
VEHAGAIPLLLEVPVISRFLGIAISILFRDHDPPHFHAVYGEFRISVTIRDGVVRGRFPGRAQAGRPLKPIPPLE